MVARAGISQFDGILFFVVRFPGAQSAATALARLSSLVMMMSDQSVDQPEATSSTVRHCQNISNALGAMSIVLPHGDSRASIT